LKKHWEVLDFGFFVSDVIIGIGFGIFAKVNRPWAPTTKAIFDSSFQWELGYNLSLLSL